MLGTANNDMWTTIFGGDYSVFKSKLETIYIYPTTGEYIYKLHDSTALPFLTTLNRETYWILIFWIYKLIPNKIIKGIQYKQGLVMRNSEDILFDRR